MKKRYAYLLGIFIVVILLLDIPLLKERLVPQCGEDSYSLAPSITGSLGVLIVYMDPGIEHSRALRVFDAAREVGATWVRIGFIWALAEPSRGEYNFAEFDWIISAAMERNLSVLPVVMFTPRWASSHPDAEDYYLYPPSNMEYLREFGKAVASHYRGKVDHWELWNEPDMKEFLKDADGDGSTAHEYAEMLASFHRGVKEGNPEAYVLLGGLADSATEPGCERDYLRKLLGDPEFPAGKYFEIHNIHTNFRSPEDIARQIRRNRDILSEFNLTKPVWVTETSYTPVKRFQNLPCYRGERGFEKYIHDALVVELNSGVEVAFWAALHDYTPSTPESDPYKYSGLYTYTLERKTAADVFENLAALLSAKKIDMSPEK